jgi:hypothetical protein
MLVTVKKKIWEIFNAPEEVLQLVHWTRLLRGSDKTAQVDVQSRGT